MASTVKCYFCKHKNPFYALYCALCYRPLNKNEEAILVARKLAKLEPFTIEKNFVWDNYDLGLLGKLLILVVSGWLIFSAFLTMQFVSVNVAQKPLVSLPSTFQETRTSQTYRQRAFENFKKVMNRETLSLIGGTFYFVGILFVAMRVLWGPALVLIGVPFKIFIYFPQALALTGYHLLIMLLCLLLIWKWKKEITLKKLERFKSSV